IKWLERIGGQKTAYPAGVLQTSDGGIAVFGGTQNYSAGADDFYLIKTDSIGNNSCNQDTFSVKKLITIAVSLDTCSNCFINAPNPKFKSIIITANNIKDSSFNDCSCYPPHANFYYRPKGYGIQDSSTWATHWYWSFGDGTQDSISISPVHIYKDTGAYTVCLKVKNACGMDSVCKLIDYQISTVSINNITNDNAISIYPNPSRGEFHISFSSNALKLMVTDITGRVVYNEAPNKKQFDINLGFLEPGIYFISVTSLQGTLVKRVMKI
ncbi:MAG TPA: T9SS type A sorting domain-containing protein, partial [Bacteroidia bacterium]|nr:T9SS type A sorting domain-containing protein [Bacteroidia bacterium]